MKKRKILSLLLIFISFVMIFIGVYLNKVTNPKAITIRFIDTFSLALKENLTPIQTSNIKDNYSISSTISITSETNDLNTKTNRIIRNLNNTKASIKYIQNKLDKKIYFQINSTKDDSELLNSKYLIENSTKYSSISNITNKYINNGPNNYLETLNKKTSNIDNLIYIYDQITTSLKQSLKNKYLKRTTTKEIINSKKDKYYITTLYLESKDIIDISNFILNSLKRDQKSLTIIETIFPEFKNLKIDEDNLKNINYFKLNIYTNTLNEFQKVECILKTNDKTTTISYEFNDQKNIGHLIEDGRVKYIFNLEESSSGKKINILNSLSKQIGQMCINQTPNKYEIVIDLDDSKSNKLKGIFSSTNIFQEEKKDYSNKTTLDLSINKLDKKSYVNLSAFIESNITENYNIEEDITTAILKSSLTETETTQINNYLQSGIYKVFEYEKG